MLTTASFGTWESPISKEICCSHLPEQGSPGRYNQLALNAGGDKAYAIEIRLSPDRPTRACIVEFDVSSTSRQAGTDILPEDYNARSTVHENGGGAFTVSPDGAVIFTDAGKKGIYVLDRQNGSVEQLVETPDGGDIRYGDFCVCSVAPRYVLAIQEDHRPKESTGVVNSIVVIDTVQKTVDTIVSGADFYTHPRFDLESTGICWIEWSQPQISWRESNLKRASWSVDDPKQVRGVAEVATSTASHPQSICQPRWCPDGSLFYVSDVNGFWQLYRQSSAHDEPYVVHLDGLEEAEFAAPEFTLGHSTYDFLDEHRIVAAYTIKAFSALAVIDISDPENPTYQKLDIPIVDIRFSALRRASAESFVVIGGTTSAPKGIYYIRLSQSTTSPSVTLLSQHPPELDGIPASLYSQPRHISFPRVYGTNLQKGNSHVMFYPPHNPQFRGPENCLPPVILSLHGGPTSHITPVLSLQYTQYWTTRGYAIAHVNYSGSSGYGRAYREALYGYWAIRDVEDVASCVAFLIDQGLVDGSRVGLRGGSAGGLTTLKSLCDYPELWAGGVSLFGIGDMSTLFSDTNKFSKWQVPALVFGNNHDLSDQQKAAVLKERSPCCFAEKITAPVLLLAGAEDVIVPPQQSEKMADAVRRNGGEVRVIVFEGEQHGLGQRANLERAIQEEELWWQKTLVRKG